MSTMVGQVLTSTAAAASLDLSSLMMACVVRTQAALLTCGHGVGGVSGASRRAWERGRGHRTRPRPGQARRPVHNTHIPPRSS